MDGRLRRGVAAAGGAPPWWRSLLAAGLYNDEASIGLQRLGRRHYGSTSTARGCRSSSRRSGSTRTVYVYALAPFTWVLPLTPYVVRLPAALFGLLTCAAAGDAGLADHALAFGDPCSPGHRGCDPWLVQESRLGFEVISGVALLLWRCGSWPGRWTATPTRWFVWSA